DRGDDAAPVQRPEGDPAVAHVHQVDGRDHPPPVPARDLVADDGLAHLVDDHDREHDRGRARPGAGHQPWMALTTITRTTFRTISPTSGLRSRGPISGMNLRKMPRNGSDTSRGN